MTKKSSRTTHAASAEPQITQAPSTFPRPRDAQGRELDQWGLPLGGRARAVALEEAGRREPRDFPEDWEDAEFLGFVGVSLGTADEPGAGDRTADSLTGAVTASPAADSGATLTEKD